METTQTPTTTDRELLLRYFKSTSIDLKEGQKFEPALNDQEYSQIRKHIDRYRGGLTRESFQQFKDDKEVIKAASISSVFKDHRIMKSRAPDVRNDLLRLLQSKPGEKNLTVDQYKQVVVFLDPKNGGIRKHAYEIFKEDKEIIEAAKQHRQNWEKKEPAEKSVAPEAKPAPTREEVQKAVSKEQKKIAHKTKGKEIEP